MSRPSKYSEEYIDKLLSYFDVQLYTVKNGKKEVNPMPTFEGFCFDNRVNHQTLLNWCKEHPKFLEAYNACKQKQKQMIVALIEHGATVVEIEAMQGMPSAATIWRECNRDPAFDQAMTDARVSSASSILDEAQHQLRKALESNDPDQMRIAAAYAQGATAYVEKIAPKQYGAMLKHAGADGGALSVAVINYAAQDMGKLVDASETLARSAIEEGKADHS
jgi:hypothetical protein